jgi:hypothetical protein
MVLRSDYYKPIRNPTVANHGKHRIRPMYVNTQYILELEKQPLGVSSDRCGDEEVTIRTVTKCHGPRKG